MSNDNSTSVEQALNGMIQVSMRTATRPWCQYVHTDIPIETVRLTAKKLKKLVIIAGEDGYQYRVNQKVVTAQVFSTAVLMNLFRSHGAAGVSEAASQKRVGSHTADQIGQLIAQAEKMSLPA